MRCIPSGVHEPVVGSKTAVGRPRKSFEAATRNTKRKIVEEDNAGKGLNQLLMSSYIKLKDEGRHEDAKQVLRMMNTDQDGATSSTTPAEALALLLDCR